MTINKNKGHTGTLNKTQYKSLGKNILYHRLNIVRQTMGFLYHFEFHLGKYELFTMYSINKRYIIFYVQL